MMRTRSAQEIREKFYARHWRERELRLVQEQLGDELLFDVLYGVFLDTNRPDAQFEDQQVAGMLLYDLKPVCHLPLKLAIRQSLDTWNRSVEELPWYFCTVFGKNAVLNALDEIEQDGALTEHEQTCLETYRYWLRADESRLFEHRKNPKRKKRKKEKEIQREKIDNHIE